MALLASGIVASPASAEPGISLSVASDDRFRGRSISGERPIATVQISYDDVRGPYAGISGTVVATAHDGLQPIRSVQYLGYAHRIGHGLTLDAGITNRVYTRYFTGEYGRVLTEGYVGIVGRRVSAHVYVTPDYDGLGGDAVYGEVNALLLERGRWSLSGHLGAQVVPPEPGIPPLTTELDWRLAATRSFGRLGVSLQWVGNGPDHGTKKWQSGAVLSATRSF